MNIEHPTSNVRCSSFKLILYRSEIPYSEGSLSLANKKLKVKAVLFDLDGTLIDSAPIYYQIIDIVFEKLGVPPVSRKTLQEAMDDGDFDWDYVLPTR